MPCMIHQHHLLPGQSSNTFKVFSLSASCQDHPSNPGEFPPPFLRGSWEGFWWALVTMTTVGYVLLIVFTLNS